LTLSLENEFGSANICASRKAASQTKSRETVSAKTAHKMSALEPTPARGAAPIDEALSFRTLEERFRKRFPNFSDHKPNLLGVRAVPVAAEPRELVYVRNADNDCARFHKNALRIAGNHLFANIKAMMNNGETLSVVYTLQTRNVADAELVLGHALSGLQNTQYLSFYASLEQQDKVLLLASIDEKPSAR